jgi:hypothetical protein
MTVALSVSISLKRLKAGDIMSTLAFKVPRTFLLRKIANAPSFWLTKVYQPTHFLTIQLPENWKSKNADSSKIHLRMIMKIFERNLLGKHWNKHHLPFIAFSENGTTTDWHYHILLNQGNFTNQELQNSILTTNIKLKLPSYCLRLDIIENNLDTVEKYCSKEIKVYWHDKFDSDRIILSDCLFSISKVKTAHK